MTSIRATFTDVQQILRPAFAVLLIILLTSPHAALGQARQNGSSWCDLNLAPILSGDGTIRLAFLVGSGEFRNDQITQLASPSLDADAVADLIASPSGYGFPKSNVCKLTGQRATRANFTSMFRRALTERVAAASRQAPVQVLFYFSGHGSYSRDQSGDEEDGLDELLVLNDSWSGGVAPIRDDELNHLLAQVYQYTHDIVVIIDACDSASVTKGTRPTDIIKMTPPIANLPAGDDTGPSLESMPGVTRLSASRDGSSAYAPPGKHQSYFTAALIAALAPLQTQPLAWSQVAQRVRGAVNQAAGGRQFPVFQGDLTKLVFATASRVRPYGWDITAVSGTSIKLVGVPLPGWGTGASIRIYDGATDRLHISDPMRAKGSAEITRFDHVTGEASLQGKPRESIEPGDIAVLSLPSPSASQLPVRFSHSPGTALPSSDVTAIIQRMRKRDDVSGLLNLSELAGAFTVESDGDKGFAIRGPEGVLREQGQTRNPDAVLDGLLRYARQQVILSIEGEPGASLRNNETLRARLTRVSSGPDTACARSAREQWIEQCPNEEQIVPLCGRWRVEVANVGTQPLRVGGAILLNDGKTVGLPYDGDNRVIPPDSRFYPLDSKWIESHAPLNVPEYVAIFGTDQSVDIDWALLTDPASSAKGRGRAHPLARALDRLLLGQKGGSVGTDDTLPWTSTRLPLRVVQNPQLEFLDETRGDCSSDSKEITLQKLDIEPYVLQANKALASVLRLGYALAKSADPEHSGDGIPYRQHGWSEGSGRATPDDDAANLKLGIDCSRAIWYAFTRNGLAYTTGAWHNGYLSTAQMIDATADSCSSETPKSSLMHENFEDCRGEPLRTGDVLVFQGKRPGSQACVGHTVMVVDPQRFIGWGSHGWDGSKDAFGQRLNDTGVEYQKILKGGWAKWDRSQYKLKACWRHRAFIDTKQ